MSDELKAWIALALALDAGLVIIVLILAATIDNLRTRITEVERRHSREIAEILKRLP